MRIAELPSNSRRTGVVMPLTAPSPIHRVALLGAHIRLIY